MSDPSSDRDSIEQIRAELAGMFGRLRQFADRLNRLEASAAPTAEIQPEAGEREAAEFSDFMDAQAASEEIVEAELVDAAAGDDKIPDVAPLPETTKKGSPPTALNARTGLLTPPTNTRFASVHNAADFSEFI